MAPQSRLLALWGYQLFHFQTQHKRQLLNKVSLDGGVSYLTLYPGGHWAWTPKGGLLTQITLLGNVASVNYEIVANLEVD